MVFTRFVCLFVRKHRWDAVGGDGHPPLGEQHVIASVGLLGDVLDGLGVGGPGGQLEEDAGLPLDWFLKHFAVE